MEVNDENVVKKIHVNGRLYRKKENKRKRKKRSGKKNAHDKIKCAF